MPLGGGSVPIVSERVSSLEKYTLAHLLLLFCSEQSEELFWDHARLDHLTETSK